MTKSEQVLVCFHHNKRRAAELVHSFFVLRSSAARISRALQYIKRGWLSSAMKISLVVSCVYTYISSVDFYFCCFFFPHFSCSIQSTQVSCAHRNTFNDRMISDMNVLFHRIFSLSHKTREISAPHRFSLPCCFTVCMHPFHSRFAHRARLLFWLAIFPHRRQRLSTLVFFFDNQAILYDFASIYLIRPHSPRPFGRPSASIRTQQRQKSMKSLTLFGMMPTIFSGFIISSYMMWCDTFWQRVLLLRAHTHTHGKQQKSAQQKWTSCHTQLITYCMISFFAC